MKNLRNELNAMANQSAPSSEPVVLHQPDEGQKAASRMAQFAEFVERKTGQDFGARNEAGFKALHKWSVEDENFPAYVWEFCDILGDRGEIAVEAADQMLATRYMTDSKVSIPENILRWAALDEFKDKPAIISRVAGRDEDRIVSWAEYYDEASRWTQVLEQADIGEGDRVAVYLPNTPEAYFIRLAVMNRGAIFSSIGSEKGDGDVITRFGVIEPKLFIAADGYAHCKAVGDIEAIDRRDVISKTQVAIGSIEKTIVVPFLNDAPDISGLDTRTVISTEALSGVQAGEIKFTRWPFGQPSEILFSSGSSGAPKAFLFGTGDTLVKNAIEHLHADIKPGDVQSFHSTLSWMMAPWGHGTQMSGATMGIYEGNIAYPTPDAQLKFFSDYKMTHGGTAADVINLWLDKGVVALDSDEYDLSNMRSLMYTASVLSAAGYVGANKKITNEASIDGICGGTDFRGCYALGNPWVSTRAGALKSYALGMDVEIWNDKGQPAKAGELGEIVIKKPFVGMPLEFWGDEKSPAFPLGRRFQTTYSHSYLQDGVDDDPASADGLPQLWFHGDAAKLTQDGQIIIDGRIDATLNQGGVRIGTKQIYDALTDVPEMDGLSISESIAVNFKSADKKDNTLLYLVVDGHDYTQPLPKEFVTAVKTAIGNKVDKLSVPRLIRPAPYVLRPSASKLAEIPTRDAVNGKALKKPETYGFDPQSGALKAEFFVKDGDEIRLNPRLGFVANPDEPSIKAG